MLLPRKCDFQGNETFWEMCCFPANPGKVWIPGKCYFPGNVTFWEMWLPGKCDFSGNVTFWEMCLQGNVTSREMWLQGNVTSQEMWPPGKCDFLGNLGVGVQERHFWSNGSTAPNTRLNIEHPQMNIWCIAAAGSWRTFPSCLITFFKNIEFQDWGVTELQ